jgi:hypothetical protein
MEADDCAPGAPYDAMPPALRELHADKETRVSTLPLDMASCVLGRMISPWLGATEAHVAAQVVLCKRGVTLAHRIDFDGAGGIVLTRLRRRSCDGIAAKTIRSPELGRVVRLTYAQRTSARPAAHVPVDSPHWEIDADAGLDWRGASTVRFTSGARLCSLAPFVTKLDEVDASATDGRGTYAVAMMAWMSGSADGVLLFASQLAAVCTPSAAFKFDVGRSRSVRALAFDPLDGSLIVLDKDCRTDGGEWHLCVVRPGPAPVPQ